MYHIRTKQGVELYMNLKQLEYFLTLAKTEHYGQAAEQVYITEPSLHRAVRELEKELGVPLFEKRGRNIFMTKYGRIFLPYIERSLQEITKGTDILKAFTCPHQGKITLGFIYTMGYTLVPAMIQQFKANDAYQGISFDFVQGTTQTLLQRLKENTIDIAFCSAMGDDGDIQFYPLVEEELVVIVPHNHPLSEKDSVSLREIGDYPFIAFNSQSGLGVWIHGMLEHAKVKANTICHMEEDNAIAGLVASGYGISIVPDFHTLPYYHVKRLRIEDDIEKRYIYMALKKQGALLPVVDTFRQFVLGPWQQGV